MTAGGLALAQDPGRVVPSDVCGLFGRRILAVGEHDVVAIAVLDVPVGIEHVPVGGAIDRGVGHQLILGEPRLEELHKVHDFFSELELRCRQRNRRS